MSDTPRTDAHNWNEGHYDDPLDSMADFAMQLERELNAANQRIKRLEREVELFREYSNYGDAGVVDSILRGEEIDRKEAKP